MKLSALIVIALAVSACSATTTVASNPVYATIVVPTGSPFRIESSPPACS
jgi:hypothetical protein